jgi:hypothetical protein
MWIIVFTTVYILYGTQKAAHLRVLGRSATRAYIDVRE